MSGRRICFTKNNYTAEDEDAILNYEGADYVLFGREVGESGTPHLQGYMELKKVCRFGPIAKKFGMYCEACKADSASNIAYCKKQGEWFEKGIPKDGAKNGGEAEKVRWQKMISMAEKGQFEELKEEYPRDYARMYSTWLKMHQDHMPIPEDRPVLENYWLWGPTGVGKSRGVREHFGTGNIYPKPLNKWWCGYQDQKVVLIEEVAPSHSDWLGEKLKVWADHYAFIGETKGKSRAIRPPIIVVTSNYSMEEVFQKEQDLEPLKRRFKQGHIIGYNNLKQIFQ